MPASPPDPALPGPGDPTVALPPPAPSVPLAKAETVTVSPAPRDAALRDPTFEIWADALARDPAATAGETIRTASGVATPRSARLSRLLPRTRMHRIASATPDAPAAPSPVPLAPDYTITRELGRGGMGVVFEARQETLERPVALKMLLPEHEGQESYEERFANEARLTGRLEHPNIVAVYDLGRTDEHRLFLGMKLVRGSSFATLLKNEPPDNSERLRRALEVLIAVTDAVGFAHARGILHRDLKPENVMVGEFGEVQLMDWGLAVDQSEPGEWVRAGTPAYMSPEQADGSQKELGTWSDVYLLGAILYEILAGSPPHKGNTVLDVLKAASAGVVQRPSERAPTRAIPSDLEALALAALERDPKRRTQTAAEVKAGLRAHLAHAEALAVVDRARALLEQRSDTLDARGEALVRAEALLSQARELWPGSDAIQGLLGRAVAAQVDLALDRGEGRAATALAARLEPGRDLPRERVLELRGAAARQLAASRNQLLAATLLAALLVVTWLVLGSLSQKRAREESVRVARSELAARTREAWDAVSSERGGEAEREALAALARTREDSGWASDETDEPLVAAAAAWQTLRRGEPRRAGQLLPEPSWRRSLDEVWAAHEGKDPLVAASAWSERARAAAVPDSLERATEACLIVSLARGLSAARLARHAPELVARLDALGARGVLADARSGTPELLLEGFEDPGAPRVRVLTIPRGDRTRRAYEVPRVVAGLDARDGHELWRFPPPLEGELEAPIISPVLLGGEHPFIAAGWGDSVLLLDLETGVVRARFSLEDEVAAILPLGAGRAAAVQRSGAGRARSRLVPFSARGLEAPVIPGSRPRTFDAVAASVWLGPARHGPDPATNARRWTARLARIAAARLIDPENAFWDFEEAQALDRLGRADEARAALARFGDRPGLSPFALASGARFAMEHPRLEASAVPLLERAVVVDAALGHDPDASPGLLGNPAFLARQAAALAAQAGKTDLMLRELALSRELSTVLEGDKSLIALERPWLEERGLLFEIDALAPYVERARTGGGPLLVPEGLVEGALPALVVFVVTPVILALAALVLWGRTNASRLRDLRALGFRNRRSRVFSFLTNPMLRISHTFLAYASRGERALFVGGALVAILAGAQLTLVVTTCSEVGAIPSEVVTGNLGHPTATEHALLAAERAPGDPRPLRYLAEGALQRGEEKRAKELLDAVLALAPSDPFALVDEGVLAERRGAPPEALALYRRAGERPGEAGAPGRWNVARLEGVPLAKRPRLPVPYDSRLRLPDAESSPLPQLVGHRDLTAVLEVGSLPSRFLRLALSWALGRGSNLLLFGDLGSTVGAFEETLRVTLRVFLFWTLVHLPFRRRTLTVPPTPGVWRSRIAQALDLAWPGVRRLGGGRIVSGACALLVAPLLALVAWEGANGGVLGGLGLLQAPTPLATTFLPDASAVALRSPQLQEIGRLAVVALGLLYAATWLGAAIRAGRALQARRNAPRARSPEIGNVQGS